MEENIAINEKIREIENGDLYAILSLCTNEDLDPLVKCMDRKLSSTLEINDDYKKYYPCHTKYYKAIGDEIRLFGGNSFKNIFRGGEGPTYDEIVVDVCKKLDIPFELGKTVNNESNVLAIYLDRQWKALSREQQDEIITDAREAASKKTFNAATIIEGGGALLLLLRPFLGLVGWPVLAAFSLAKPAFKVTISCVLHIAYLRKKILDGEAASFVDSYIPAGSAENVSLVPATTRSASLVVGVSEDEPALSLTWISNPTPQAWYPVDDSDEGISRLNPLLQAVPNFSIAGELTSTKYMEVVIDGPLVKATGINGGYRGFRIVDGKIESHAILFEPSKLSKIVNASALLQVASVAVAQKHLADINEKLSEIKACVDKIHQFQKNERRSVLTGATRYFEQVAQSVLAGELSDAIRNQIEDHEANLLQVQDHLMEDIRHESKEIINIKGKDTFGSKGMQNAISSHQKLLDDLYQQLMLCIRARACGWQLLVVFPGEERLKEKRKCSIQESLKALAEGGDLLKKTDMFMRNKIKELSSVWNRTATLNKRKLSLLEWNDTLMGEITSCKAQIVRDIRAAEAVINDRRQPVTMVVKVEGDRIVAACAK
ncbi:MAG: hypothetical protein WA081_15210 [Desulfosalsimonadaceae bacterium]